ncbi:hypothetical protein CRUP_035282, partial [Coryphaenoides rupestris]
HVGDLGNVTAGGDGVANGRPDDLQETAIDDRRSSSSHRHRTRRKSEAVVEAAEAGGGGRRPARVLGVQRVLRVLGVLWVLGVLRVLQQNTLEIGGRNMFGRPAVSGSGLEQSSSAAVVALGESFMWSGASRWPLHPEGPAVCQDVEMACSFRGAGTPSYSLEIQWWYIRNHPDWTDNQPWSTNEVSPGEGLPKDATKISVVKVAGSNISHKLRLSSVRPSDEGTYECRVIDFSDAAGARHHRARAYLQVAPQSHARDRPAQPANAGSHHSNDFAAAREVAVGTGDDGGGGFRAGVTEDSRGADLTGTPTGNSQYAGHEAHMKQPSDHAQGHHARDQGHHARDQGRHAQDQGHHAQDKGHHGQDKGRTQRLVHAQSLDHTQGHQSHAQGHQTHAQGPHAQGPHAQGPHAQPQQQSKADGVQSKRVEGMDMTGPSDCPNEPSCVP